MTVKEALHESSLSALIMFEEILEKEERELGEAGNQAAIGVHYSLVLLRLAIMEVRSRP